jgi:hypothetical protein
MERSKQAGRRKLDTEVAPIAWTLGLGGHWFMIASFEFIRTQVTESRVPSLAIVKAPDVFEDFGAGLSSAVPLTVVNQFELEGSEEALRYRVVPAVSLAAHAAADSVPCQQPLIFRAGVLATAIRVMQQSLGRLSSCQCHVHRFQRKLSFQPFVQSPTDYPAREQIQDHRQIQPALESPQIGDVGDPAGVGCEHRKPPRQQIPCYCHSVVRVGGAAKASTLPRTQACYAHQPRHALARRPLATHPQLGVYPRTALAAATLREDRCDLQPQALVLEGGGAAGRCCHA